MIVIHKAKAENVKDIKKLLFETWTSVYSKTYPPEAIKIITSEWHNPVLLTKQIQDPSILFIIAKENNTLLAMCNTNKVEGEIINIQRLHVIPKYQRRGIGSMLLEEVIRSFPKLKSIQLEVEKQNWQAISFYHKHGFKKVGEKVFKISSIQMPSFVMEKKI